MRLPFPLRKFLGHGEEEPWDLADPAEAKNTTTAYCFQQPDVFNTIIVDTNYENEQVHPKVSQQPQPQPD
jgi:hypothetical protein